MPEFDFSFTESFEFWFKYRRLVYLDQLTPEQAYAVIAKDIIHRFAVASNISFEHAKDLLNDLNKAFQGKPDVQL